MARPEFAWICPYGSAEYIRVLCGYLFCIGNYEDAELIQRAKNNINFDVGCMIDGDWIEALTGNISEKDKQVHMQKFKCFYVGKEQ